MSEAKNIDDEPDRRKARPWCYLSFLPGLTKVAHEYGYALAIHGSMSRDFDLIAVPWLEGAYTATNLADAIRMHVGGIFTSGDPRTKPHGRLAWAIHIGANELYLDLSVMPRLR